jgi:hypothetical protein
MSEKNKDKRSVFTDALETLGNIIDDKQKRDAIHLAVEPVVAMEMLLPGSHVTVDGRLVRGNNGVGIVDPFLIEPVLQGQRFWLVVYPRTIKSLRHVWEHPEFPASEIVKHEEEMTTDTDKVKISKEWMIAYAEEINSWSYNEEDEYHPITYQELMEAAKDYLSNGSYWNLGSQLEGESLHSDFWYHYEIISGENIEEDKQQSFFTCSC